MKLFDYTEPVNNVQCEGAASERNRSIRRRFPLTRGYPPSTDTLFFLPRSNLHLKDDPTTPEIETPIAFQAAVTNLPFTTPNHLNCL